jgi:uracil-DNA glycosylase
MSEQFDLFASLTEPTPVIGKTIPQDVKIPIVPGTYPSLDALKADCEICERCSLSKSRTQAVIERGSRTAKLMIIGEAPGENEDLEGKPFVGKSGQLLDKILASVQFDTITDIYITNTIRCRPPENRVPSPQEVAACSGYLREQIRLVNPWIILLTGAVSMKAILNETKGITKVRGQWRTWEDYYVMPIFHPAYLLRNQSREVGAPKWLMWQDIQAVRTMYDRIAAGEPVADLLP